MVHPGLSGDAVYQSLSAKYQPRVPSSSSITPDGTVGRSDTLAALCVFYNLEFICIETSNIEWNWADTYGELVASAQTRQPYEYWRDGGVLRPPL